MRGPIVTGTQETSDALSRARAAFELRDWEVALDSFAAAHTDELTPADVFRRADAAWWVGRIDDALAWYEVAFRGHLDADEPRRAALAALLLGAHASERGDEATVMAVADELHPLWTGAIYCHCMDACHELHDVQRAAEWTEATARWCDAVGEAVVYRGICRVHRAQVFQRQGDWDQAEAEARRAGEDLPRVLVGTGAEAHYEVGEVRRLRGDLDGAETAYRRAHELGRTPQPGLALLRAQQGKADTAATSLRAALAERTGDPLGRVPLAAALVELATEAGEVETARAAAAELRTTAADYASAGLDALARQAAGQVHLADDEPEVALAALREACRAWHDLDVPHEAARTRLLLARTLQALGDHDAARLELDAAVSVFDRLGAVLDRQHAEALQPELAGAVPAPDGLSPREVEILQQVATGRTNQQIADELVISDKTVARHVANVYRKIGVGTRAAATAYAYQEGLARPPTAGT